MDSVFTMFGIIFLLLFFGAIIGSFFTVQTAEVAIVQRLGKFARVAGPGLNWKTPFIENVVRRMSMKVLQFDVQVETKTQDNVFVKIPVSIQYKVIPEGVEAAFYKLSDPVKQIESMVYNVVLGHVPKMKLDDTFINQAAIAKDLRDSLDASMREYGYTIVKVLISDIVPDPKVKAAMNDINAAAREREATVSRAETNKLLLVKQAEAEAESKRLQGEGIANQRKAIIAGLKDSIEDFSKAVAGATAQDVMHLVLITQYFDTLKDVASNDRTNTVLVPHSPGTISDLFDQFRNAMVTSQALVNLAVERFGRLDILVNNAGVFNPKPFLELPEKDYDWYLDTILKGKFFAAQAAAKAMKEHGGAIVQTGSMWAIQAIGATPSAAYSAANAGVHAMVRNLAIELACYKIRVNAVAPAVVETPVYNTFMSADQVAQVLPTFNEFHPLGRNGQPKDVADAILFLASDEASWITGTVLPVDGGVTAGRI